MSNLGDLYTESGQTLESSFAAVSKPMFAPKYAFFSIKSFHTFAPLPFAKNVLNIVRNLQNVGDFFVNLHYFDPKSSFLTPISTKISRNFN